MIAPKKLCIIIYIRNCRQRPLLLSSTRCGIQIQPLSRLFQLLTQPTGAHMKLSVSFKDLENHKSIEKELDHAVAKLNVLLRTYQPDLVQLHAVFSKVPRKDEHTLTLNLTLPTGTLHASASCEHLRACCKRAFSEIASQVKKHKSLLRKDYEWKRKRPRPRISAEAFS